MEQIFRIGRVATYKKGEILVRPSDTGGEFFVIKTGIVHAYTIEESGEKNVHVVYGNGDMFPVAWIIKKTPLNIFYEAIEQAEVIRIPADDARVLLQSDARLSYEILKQVTSQFVTYKARVDNLEYKFARERIAYRLLLLSKKIGTAKGSAIEMYRFNQDEIAAQTNASRESVSREMRRFERLKLISYSNGMLVINDTAGLRAQVASADSALFIDDI